MHRAVQLWSGRRFVRHGAKSVARCLMLNACRPLAQQLLTASSPRSIEAVYSINYSTIIHSLLTSLAHPSRFTLCGLLAGASRQRLISVLIACHMPVDRRYNYVRLPCRRVARLAAAPARDTTLPPACLSLSAAVQLSSLLQFVLCIYTEATECLLHVMQHLI